jgi:hypothetical protein
MVVWYSSLSRLPLVVSICSDLVYAAFLGGSIFMLADSAGLKQLSLRRRTLCRAAGLSILRLYVVGSQVETYSKTVCWASLAVLCTVSIVGALIAIRWKGWLPYSLRKTGNIAAGHERHGAIGCEDGHNVSAPGIERRQSSADPPTQARWEANDPRCWVSLSGFDNAIRFAEHG